MKIIHKIELAYGDITKIEVDAIVNSAHTSLMKGSGLCGIIHVAAGQELEKECLKKYNGCPIGEAVITYAYNLPCKYVIHTVGPRLIDISPRNKEAIEIKYIQLSDCYTNSLRIAAQNELTTIAFPSISTGKHSFPTEKASDIAIKAISKFINTCSIIEKVYIICNSVEDYDVYSRKLQEMIYG